MTSRIGIAMVGLAIASLVVSSGGVSSVALERPIEIEVADDESEQTVVFEGARNGSGVEVTNQAARDLAVENATVDDDRVDWASNVAVRSPDDPIPAGETATIELSNVPCDDIETETIPVDIRLATGSTTIETTADATVACDE